MTDPDRAAERDREEEAREVDEILQRINVGPQDPRASGPRLNRAVSLIWALCVGLVLAVVSFIVIRVIVH